MIRLIASSFAVFILSGASRANDLGALCQAGHEQARGQIERLKCQVVVSNPAKVATDPFTGRKEKRPASRIETQWYQESEKWRSLTRYDEGEVFETVWDGKEFRRLQEDPRRRGVDRYFGEIGSSKIELGIETPWQIGLFGWPGTMPVKLEKPSLEKIEESNRAGVRYIIAYTKRGNSLQETWFTPGRNFLVSKTVLYLNRDDQSRAIIREVLSFAEPKPGIFFPTQISSYSLLKGKQLVIQKATIDKIEINGSASRGIYSPLLKRCHRC